MNIELFVCVDRSHILWHKQIKKRRNILAVRNDRETRLFLRFADREEKSSIRDRAGAIGKVERFGKEQWDVRIIFVVADFRYFLAANRNRRRG